MRPIVVLVLAFAALFSSVDARSAQDSIAVFHRPEKVIVLINEAGSRAPRLFALMESLSPEREFRFETADATTYLQCVRSDTAASCTFRFLPSPSTVIGEKSLDVSLPLEMLGLDIPDRAAMTFESSREDRFTLSVESGVLNIEASKRILR